MLSTMEMGALRDLRIGYTNRACLALRKRSVCDLAGHQGVPDSQSQGVNDSSYLPTVFGCPGWYQVARALPQ